MVGRFRISPHTTTGRRDRSDRRARPMVDFSQEVFDRICERIAEGESLRAICEDADMPNKANVLRWLIKDEALRDQYARARELQADTLFEDVLDIADDARNDWMERRGEEDAGWVANGEHIQRSRLRVDARKWMAGKLKPKVYGDKVELNGNPDAPLLMQVLTGVPRSED